MTDSRPDADSTPSKPRGLWSLMGTPSTPTDSPPETVSPESTVDRRPEAESPTSVPKPTESTPATVPPRQRGLWGMMGQGAANEAAESQQDQPPDAIAPTPDVIDHAAHQPKGPRGLFALMQQTDEGLIEDLDSELPDEDVDQPKSPARSNLSPSLAARRDDTDDDIDDVEMEMIDDEEENSSRRYASTGVSSLTMEAIEPNDLEPTRFRVAAAKARQQAWVGLGCGIAAVLASALSLLPNFLASLPATAIGFFAIISAYLALTGAGRREITSATRVVCLAGMLLGTSGIFLGPLLFSGIGRSLRDASGQQSTRLHLQQIATGLDRHYAQHDGYPIGGTFGRNDAGTIVGLHGWMTFLLPFVGESELYQKIDQSVSYEDPVNRNVMGRNVTIYFAAGGDRSRIGEGFAVSHFAGLGGEIDDASGLSHLGIFERDVSVKREEVTDGLSNTLIVGELAGTYPPWGDPENWRKIGRGLNKDVNGFGSYNNNGASFLLGDGSVKHFSNKTDPKVLERMSTRDGGE